MEIRRRPRGRLQPVLLSATKPTTTRRSAGYAKVDLHTFYDLTENVQLYGLIYNLFNSQYGLFGNFFNLEAANEASEANPATGDDFFTNPRTITPAPPLVAYGGMKIHY